MRERKSTVIISKCLIGSKEKAQKIDNDYELGVLPLIVNDDC